MPSRYHGSWHAALSLHLWSRELCLCLSWTPSESLRLGTNEQILPEFATLDSGVVVHMMQQASEYVLQQPVNM